MLNSSPLVATTPTTTALAFATASSLSSSLPLHTNLPLHHRRFSLTSALHFTSIKHLKLHTNFSNLHAITRSATFCTSADSITVIQEEEESEFEGAEPQSYDSGKLYVGNLPFSLASSQLSEIFSEAGLVRNVEIVYDRVTGRSRGFAFVTMGSIEEANEAIRMFNECLVGGRTVKVNFPEVPKGGEREVMASRIRSSYPENTNSPYKIYAANLSWSLTSQGLRDAFVDQPGLLHANVVYDKDSGRSRGYGFVSFASAEDLESALNAMNEVEVEGRPLRLNVAKERSPTLQSFAVETNP